MVNIYQNQDSNLSMLDLRDQGLYDYAKQQMANGIKQCHYPSCLVLDFGFACALFYICISPARSTHMSALNIVTYCCLNPLDHKGSPLFKLNTY